MFLTQHLRSLSARLLVIGAICLPAFGPSAFAQSTSISFGNQTFTNQGLVGVGRLPSNLKDKFGETFGSFSAFTVDPATLQFTNGKITGTLYAQPDRGYNAAGTTDYVARYNIINFSFTPSTTGSATQDQVGLTLADTIQYKESNGTLFTSLDPLTNDVGTRPGFPALPVGANGRITLDPEGIVRLRDGSLYVSDEYGPYIYHFASNGTLLSAIRPPEALVAKRNGADSFASNNPGPGAPIPSPADPTTGRQNNQGLEGLTMAPDGRTLYALLQSATRQDGGTGGTSATRFNTRLLAYDVTGATPTLKGEYVVQLPTFLQGASTRVAAQSEALALNNTQFLVVTRDSGNGHGLVPTSVYRTVSLYDIAGATNIAGTAYDTATGSIAPGGALISTITPATRAELININDATQLAKFGLHNGLPDDRNNLSEKWEGLALVPALDAAAPDDVYLFVGNDNDFLTTDGFQAGTTYNAGVDNDSMILVYRLTLPTYVDSFALQSAVDTGSPLVATAWNHTLNLARLASRDIGGHLAALRIGESGQRGFSAFAGGNWAKLDDDARGNYAGYKADGWTATGGVDYTFEGKVTLGLAASKVGGDADVNGGWGRVEASGAGVSGFLSVDLGHVFFEAFYGHHELDYDLARNTGAYGLKATASTKGSTDALGGTVGWKGRLGNFQYTLDGGVDRMSGDIDSFTEAGAMHLNLLVPALAPRSTQWHASAQLAQEFTVNTWRITPYAAAEYRRENDSESQPFTLALANRTTVSGASITGGTPVRDDKFWEGRVGVVAAVTDRIGATLEAAKTFSNDDSAQHSVRFSVNYRF